MKPFSLPALVVLFGTVLWALSEEPSSSSIALQQEIYRGEQAKIDLALAELALEAVNGEADPEKVQEKVDLWLRDNAKRLADQATRAADLDAIAPLPPDIPSRTPPDSPEAQQLAELEDIEFAVLEALQTDGATGEELQFRFDEWLNSKDGILLQDQKAALVSRMTLRHGFGGPANEGLEPSDALPAEIEALAIQARMAKRVEHLHLENPQADPETLQWILDESMDEVERDVLEMSKLYDQARKARLAADVDRLRDEVSAPLTDQTLPKEQQP